MKLSQLRYFCEACRVNNITQAAKNLYVSQSAVSVQIKELEEEFDVRLFVRDNNRLQLTEAGQKLWKHAQQILRQADQVSLEMAELKNRSGRLRVNLTPSCIPCILPLLGETFRQLRDKYPNVELQIQEEPAGGAAAQLLLEGRADLALMSMAKEPPRQLESETLYSSALLACVSRRHPLAFVPVGADRLDAGRFGKPAQRGAVKAIRPGAGLSVRLLSALRPGAAGGKGFRRGRGGSWDFYAQIGPSEAAAAGAADALSSGSVLE